MPRLRESFKSISSFFIAFSFIFTLLHWNMAAILFFWIFRKTRLFQKYKTPYKRHKEQHLSLKILFFFRQNPWIFSIFPLFFTKNGGHLGFLQKKSNFEIPQACIFGQVTFLQNIMFLTQLVLCGGRKNDFSLKIAWFGKEKSHLAP